MEYTQGKWEVSAPVSTIKNAYTIISDGIYIAEMFALGEDSCQADSQEAQANANLIASAPDLLEALRECIGALKIIRAPQEALEKAQQAIAKAEGKYENNL